MNKYSIYLFFFYILILTFPTAAEALRLILKAQRDDENSSLDVASVSFCVKMIKSHNYFVIDKANSKAMINTNGAFKVFVYTIVSQLDCFSINQCYEMLFVLRLQSFPPLRGYVTWKNMFIRGPSFLEKCTIQQIS